jgi:hypothetical protein
MTTFLQSHRNMPLAGVVEVMQGGVNLWAIQDDSNAGRRPATNIHAHQPLFPVKGQRHENSIPVVRDIVCGFCFVSFCVVRPSCAFS